MHSSLMNDELLAFKDSFKRFVESEITPFHEEWEKQGIHPKELYLKAGEQGFLCTGADEKYGGLGLDFRFAALMIEELAYSLASGVAFFLHSDIVVPYVEHYGSEEQKKAWLPKLISGELISAIAMTEPGTGSDLQAIKTKAERKGDKWVLNGAKTFISNGHNANFIIVCAETESEGPQQRFKPLSLFVVETGTPGFERGRNLSKMGLKAQDTAELSFQNCLVSDSHVLGEIGKGFVYLTNELAQERLTVAIWCVATAKRCLDMTLAYVKERKAFGKRVADFQNTRFKLAEMATEIELGQSLVDRCTQDHIQGQDTTVSASMAKYWTSEMLGRVADECVQLFGGYGYMNEYPIARAFLDARVQRIFAGTTEIMKEIISRDLLK